MILEPKSKPVKFRIRSGGEEHSSLDSLRKNFVWEDVKPLCGSGKQLEKWLERVDANVAKRYKKIENPSNNVLKVYNVLFYSENEQLVTNADVFNKIEALTRNNESDDLTEASELDSLKVLCRYLIPELAFNELVQYVINYKFLHNLLDPEFILQVQRNQDKITPKDLFALGKRVFDSGQNPELAEEWIRIASSKGFKKATKFIEEYFEEARDIIRQRFFGLISNDKLRRKLKESWDDEVKIGNWNSFGKEERRIVSLSDICMEIFLCQSGGVITDAAMKDMYQIAENKFGSVRPDDLLYEEKVFVMSLVDYDTDRAMSRLKSIESYLPAKYLLCDKNNTFIAGSRKYKIGYQFGNVNNFDFWILNLERFSQPEMFQEMLSSYEVFKDDIDYWFLNPTVTSRINYSWKLAEYLYPINELTLQNQIFKFSDKCLEIYKLIQSKRQIGDIELSEEIVRIMNERLIDSDPLYLEKVFIMGMFAKNFDLARQQMKKIENSYAPAYRLANDETHTLSIEGHVYSICDGLRRKNANELEYFIKNLPKFRKNVRFYK